MENSFLVVTSIAAEDHPGLSKLASEALRKSVHLIVIGDLKSPKDFNLSGCDYYSIKRQQSLEWSLGKKLPLNHYSRKNIGYLEAISKGAEIIIETDDDNLPLANFWENRNRDVVAFKLSETGWINIYRYFTEYQVWPRGFALEHIHDLAPDLINKEKVHCPIQQGLANLNPDVDAIHRLILPMVITFNESENIALGNNSICPFNSQNTTWFKEAFLLMYLPSYCSFRMTDIWRSFVAQRIAWTCGWKILFHQSTMYQERNDHNLINDLKDEFSGYMYNSTICTELQRLNLKNGTHNIQSNLIICYQLLVDLGFIDKSEMNLLNLWISDIARILK